ncbi:putative membrane protein [Candidatus Moduliflexus flocculans]|uniref:Putative membrane protein n=1 Tax=Candidatus Moduliflexus flocculans TaxID=1499966 RepID=A0A0S6VU74_9BACT|nr:putative membrane protein [Candidatus Moduliflexus flocculans]
MLFIVFSGLTEIFSPLEYGLTVSYYENIQWDGAPLITETDATLSLERIHHHFPKLQSNYSILWEGAIFIPKTGEYSFIIGSDDGSDFYIDDTLLIDNRGEHTYRERSGRVTLTKGFHAIALRYMQGGGMSIFRAYWQAPGQKQTALRNAPLYVRALSPQARIGYGFLEICRKIALIVCVLICLIVFGNWLIKQYVLWQVKTQLLFIGLLIGLIVFIIYAFFSPITNAYDSMWSIHTALSLIRDGNSNLDEYEKIVKIYRYHVIEKFDNHLYNVYPIGASVMAIPHIFLADLLMKNVWGVDLHTFITQYVRGGIPKGLERLIASTYVAGCVSLMFFIALQYGLSRHQSLIFAMTFAFSTSAWSVGSRGLWQHGPAMLLLAGALYCLFCGSEKSRYESLYIGIAGFLLAFSYVVRPTNAFSIFVLTIYIFLKHKKYLLSYIWGSLFVTIPYLLFNIYTYHLLLPTYSSSTRDQLKPSLVALEGLAGLLFSPSRGLFVYSPILLLVFYGVALKRRARKWTALDLALAIILILHWGVTALHPRWWGGHSYGPRYFTEMLPYLFYFLLPVWQQIEILTGKKRRMLVVVMSIAVLLGVLIHARGAISEYPYGWNAYPVSVDQDHRRVWDIQDIQFLRGLFE